MTVTLYTKADCQQCRATERSLNEKGVEFVEKVATEPANLEVLKQLGHMQAPVVTVDPPLGGGVSSWSGFRPDYIEQLVAERLDFDGVAA